MLRTMPTTTVTMDAIQFISDLVKNSKKVGIFSCEDPYNIHVMEKVTKQKYCSQIQNNGNRH